MTELFVYFDPESSFLAGSIGAAKRRLADRRGRVHLGAEAWELGCKAFSQFRTADGGAVSTADLRDIARSVQAEIPRYHQLIRDAVQKGKITLAEPIVWDDVTQVSESSGPSWSSQIVSLLSVISQLPAWDPPEFVDDYADWIAIGCLGCLEDAVGASVFGIKSELAASMMDAQWLMDAIFTADAVSKSVSVKVAGAESARQSKMAKKRHEGTPIQKAKKVVYACFLALHEDPGKYPGHTAFARAMLDKFPDDLTSEVVVSRWAAQWKRQLS